MNRVTVVKFISNVAYKKKYTLLTRKKNVNESFSFTYLGLKLKLFLMYVKHHNHIKYFVIQLKVTIRFGTNRDVEDIVNNGCICSCIIPFKGLQLRNIDRFILHDVDWRLLYSI